MMEYNNLEFNNLSSKDEVLIQLMDLYGNMVKRLAYTYVKDMNLSEDIVQDVFIKCYNNLSLFEGRSKYKTWIYKITINCSKDVLKNKFYKNFLPFKKNVIQSHTKTPEVLFMEKDKHSLVTSCLLSLPPNYREIIYLFYYEELKISEIHEVTNLNTETIKTRLRRGKLLLKKELERMDIEL